MRGRVEGMLRGCGAQMAAQPSTWCTQSGVVCWRPQPLAATCLDTHLRVDASSDQLDQRRDDLASRGGQQSGSKETTGGRAGGQAGE